MNFYNYGCAWIWFWQRDVSVTEEPHKDRRKKKYERKKV